MAVGLDHNASPREDLSKYGDAAVSAGKLSRRRLAQIQRMEGAHQNSVEGFTFFVAGGECLLLCFAFWREIGGSGYLTPNWQKVFWCDFSGFCDDCRRQ